MTLFRCVFAV